MEQLNLEQMNRAAWGQEMRKHQLLYPDERVVAFVATHYPDTTANSDCKALDIGFGSGRHVQLLLNYGFQVYGIDYAQEAVEIARSLWKDHPRLQELRVADLRERPYPDEFFDLVIAWGVSFLRPVEEMAKDFQVINALMKNGARLVVNFRTADNWFYGKGKPLGNGAFLLDESAGAYSGMCYTFLDFDQASNLLSQANFEIENSERLDLWKHNRSEHHSWWIFWLRKGKG